jgi:threonine dehydrogenase-like Zn-dependent dehydrogenase
MEYYLPLHFEVNDMTIRELWHINEKESTIRSEVVIPEKEDLIIQSEFSLISSGTEGIIVRGEVPKELQLLMNVPFMQGSLALPVKYGYSIVGRIVQGTSGQIGKYVHLMHPHQDWIVGKNFNFLPIPDNIPPEKATLISNIETAINAVWDSKVTVGDRILICGFGLIGALTALVIRHIEATEITILEQDPERQKIANDLDFKLYNKRSSGIGDFDLAFNTSASGEGLQQCIDLSGEEATIVEMSWYGIKPIQISLGTTFHLGRKRIISTQVSEIPFDKQARYTIERRKKLALTLLQHGIFDKLPLTQISFIDSPGYFNRLRQRQNPNFCTIIKYR